MVPVLSYSESGFSDPYAYFAYYLVSNGLPVCEYIATGGLSGVPMGSGGIAICRSGFHGAGGGEVGQPGVLCEICKGSVGRPGWTVGLGRSWSADSANTELSERCARIKSGASERTVDGTLQDNDSIAEDGSGSCGSRRTGDSDFVRGVPADTTRRGPNWHRNVRKRQRRREKTLRAIADSEFKTQRSAGSGFFSGCDDDLLKDLRESRARMLIAQNNSKTVEATRRIGMIDTSVDVLEKVVKMGELASRAEKMSSVGDVMSWAGRAAISRSETLACQAPPNLVPYRKSASSAGEVTVESKPSVKPKIVKGKHKVRSEKPGFISQPHGRPLDAPGKLVELGVVRPGDTRYDNDPDVIYINRTQWTGSIPGSGDSYEVRVAYRRPARRSMDSKPNGNYGWCLEDVPATKLEQRVLELGILDKTSLVEMRNARARVLGLYDFKSLDFMHITEEVFEELGAIYKAMIT